MTGASASTSDPAKNGLASAVGELVYEDSSLDPSRPRTPGVRSDPDVVESMETVQLHLDQNAAVGVYIEEHNDQRFPLERETQSVDPLFDTQDDSCSAHISAADAWTQLEHPGSWQIPPFNDDQSSASQGIHAEQVRRAVDQQDEQSTYEPIFDNEQVTGPTSALVLDSKLLEEGPDCTSHGTVGPRDQSPDSTSDGHESVIANVPRVSMDVQTRPNPVPLISCDDVSPGKPPDASLPTAIGPRDQDTDRCSEPAAMPSQSLISPKRTAGHDLSIYPLDRTDSYLLTAVASDVQELQQLSASSDAWLGPQTVSASDHFTVLSIKPLGDEWWLLLAKVSRLTHTDSRPNSRGEEAADCHMETRRKREIVGNRGTLVNNRGRPVNSANGRLSRRKRGNWKQHEDQKLARMAELGVPWSSILAGFPRRSEAAVRSRWNNELKPLVQ